MLRLGEILTDGREFEAVAEAVEGGDDGGGFRAEREGDRGVRADIRLADGRAGVIHAEHGNGGAQDIHGAGVLGRVF